MGISAAASLKQRDLGRETRGGTGQEHLAAGVGWRGPAATSGGQDGQAHPQQGQPTNSPSSKTTSCIPPSAPGTALLPRTSRSTHPTQPSCCPDHTQLPACLPSSTSIHKQQAQSTIKKQICTSHGIAADIAQALLWLQQRIFPSTREDTGGQQNPPDLQLLNHKGLRSCPFPKCPANYHPQLCLQLGAQVSTDHRVGTQEKIAGLAGMLQLAKLLPGTHVLQLKKIIRKIFRDENSEFFWSPEIQMLVALSCPPRGCGARGVICKGT